MEEILGSEFSEVQFHWTKPTDPKKRELELPEFFEKAGLQSPIGITSTSTGNHVNWLNQISRGVILHTNKPSEPMEH